MNIWDIRPEEKKIALKLEKSVDLQLIEEMAELTQVLIKRRRYLGEGQPTDKSSRDLDIELAEEITDVLICLKEIVFVEEIDDDTLKAFEDFKVERTMERLGMKEWRL